MKNVVNQSSSDVNENNPEQFGNLKRPQSFLGGPMPEYSLWQPRMTLGPDGQWKETGIRSPDGIYYFLKDGERFVINKGEQGDYEAVIYGKKGEKRILRKSETQQESDKKSLDKVQIEALRNQIGIVNKSPGGKETKESHELNEKVKIAAEYLGRLDQSIESVQIDSNTGRIHYIKPKLAVVSDSNILNYQTKFTELLAKFANRNRIYLEKLKHDPDVLDVKEVEGAIVVTIDSLKGIPKSLSGETFELNSSGVRGSFGTTSEQYLGLAIIDINQEKRKDAVSPTISGVHELHHYTLSVSDYLISQDESIGLQSAYREGRKTALFGSAKDRVTSNQAVWNDQQKYSKLLGRKFDFPTDNSRLTAQLNYLNELHSSFLQRKENWFHVQENVYAMGKKGKHWELVGDHPADVAAGKKLLGYLQGFYTLEKIRITWQQRLDNGENLGEGQKAFLKDCVLAFNKVGSLIGASRTVRQAETLVAEAWNDFIVRHPRVTKTTDFLGMIDQWEKGAGVENLKNILLKGSLPGKSNN